MTPLHINTSSEKQTIHFEGRKREKIRKRNGKKKRFER